MAFNQEYFAPVSGSASGTPKLWSYSTSDSLATVEVDGYFNSKIHQLEVGDVFLVVASDGVVNYRVTSVTDNVTITQFSGSTGGFSCVNTGTAVGTTGVLTTTFKVLNSTNFTGLTYTGQSSCDEIETDPVTGETSFSSSGVMDLKVVFNAVGGNSNSRFEIIPEFYRGGSWNAQPARVNDVANNFSQQVVFVGSRDVVSGDKIRLNIRGATGDVSVASEAVTDGILSSTVPAVIVIVVLHKG